MKIMSCLQTKNDQIFDLYPLFWFTKRERMTVRPVHQKHKTNCWTEHIGWGGVAGKESYGGKRRIPGQILVVQL